MGICVCGGTAPAERTRTETSPGLGEGASTAAWRRAAPPARARTSCWRLARETRTAHGGADVLHAPRATLFREGPTCRSPLRSPARQGERRPRGRELSAAGGRRRAGDGVTVDAAAAPHAPAAAGGVTTYVAGAVRAAAGASRARLQLKAAQVHAVVSQLAPDEVLTLDEVLNELVLRGVSGTGRDIQLSPRRARSCCWSGRLQLTCTPGAPRSRHPSRHMAQPVCRRIFLSRFDAFVLAGRNIADLDGNELVELLRLARDVPDSGGAGVASWFGVHVPSAWVCSSIRTSRTALTAPLHPGHFPKPGCVGYIRNCVTCAARRGRTRPPAARRNESMLKMISS